jgi:hypothetical protein
MSSMPKAFSIINNPQGSIITMAMIFLALLTVIGITATTTSTTEVKMSKNAVLHNVAFYTVDSGVAAGRAALNNIKLVDAGAWNILLRNLVINADDAQEEITWKGSACTTLDDIISAGGGRTVGPATFTLELEDNDDLDGHPETDSDDTVILTSTLVSPYLNATVTIRTTVRGGGKDDAQEHYNAGSSGYAAAESVQASTSKRIGG